MGKDYRDEYNRDKRFRGKKPDLSKKENPHKKKKVGHHGQKFHENVEGDEPFNNEPNFDSNE